MNILPIVLSGLPIISTMIGGLAVYTWKKDLHPWLSLSGGILLGVAFLDLLPEAITRGTEAGIDIKVLTGTTLAAILLFHFLDKALSFHAHHNHAGGEPAEACANDRHQSTKAIVRASSMILHSMLDGIAIGGGFAVNTHLGIIITLAVIMHDFSDGMSTVTMLRTGFGPKHRAVLPMLTADAIAPFIGAFIGMALAPSSAIIAIMISVFSGFFIFLALSDLLPQAHSGTMSRKFGLFLTTLGIGLVLFIQMVAKV